MKYRIVKEETMCGNYVYHIEKKTLFGWRQIDWTFGEEAAIKLFENYAHPKGFEKKVIREYDTKLKEYTI